MIEHLSKVGVGNLGAIIVHEGVVPCEDAGAVIHKVIGIHGKRVPEGCFHADISLQALLRGHIRVAQEQRTDAAGAAAEVGTHALDEASGPGVVLLVQIPAAGLEAFNSHVGLVGPGKAGRCPDAQFINNLVPLQEILVGGIPAKGDGGIGNKLLSGSEGVGAEYRQADSCVISVVIGPIGLCGEVGIAVFPVVESAAGTVEVGDVGAKLCRYLVKAEFTVPSKDYVTLHPALLA